MKESRKTVSESEDQLIETAQNAVSQCNWVVGECASKWTKKYAKGRTDADFGTLVGLSGDQVFQRRHVWDTFSDVRDEYKTLKWSHFYVAMNWDDAPECLAWATENTATVAEMKAWRRLQHGEDLTTSTEFEDVPDELVSIIPMEPALVRDPASNEGDGASRAKSNGGSARTGGSAAATVGTAARETDDRGSDYVPFRAGAGSPSPAQESSSEVAVATKPQASPVQTVKRMTSSIERCTKVLTPEFAEEFRRLPDKVRNRFIKAVGELSSKTAGLMK